MSLELQYAIDVIEGIGATVDGGLYNIVSHTPLNPLLLDETVIGLLERAAGTSIDVLKNDLGETIGYAAKGVANAGNGAATEISTRVAVLTKETVVDAEMAAGSYIEASTGAAAELTVGETVTEVAASSTGAGLLATPVPAVGAAIAPALGLVAGLALYNIAPEFWTSVSEKLVAAGETIGGKVIGLVNTDNSTSYSAETIEIFKNAFIEAGFYDEIGTVSVNDETVPESYRGLEIPLYREGACGYTWDQWPEDGPTMYGYYNGTDPIYTTEILNGTEHNPIVVTASKSSFTYNLFNGKTGTIGRLCDSEQYTRGGLTYYAGRYTNSTERNPITSVIDDIISVPYVYWTDIIGLIAYILVYGATKKNEDIQEDATLPTADPFPQTYPGWQPNKSIQGKDYYPVSEPTDDITQAPSQSGANDSDEQQDKIASKLYDPSPDPTPKPQPDPEPEPQPKPEEPLPQEVIPAPDPINPNPEPEPSDPTPVVPVPGSTLVGRMYTVYNPTEAQVNSLGAYLWDFDIIEQIRKMWEDPMQAIISFHKVYCTPSTGSTQNIMLGYLDSHVPSKVVTSQFAEVDCGTLYVAERLGNATDYPPFTKIHLFLPFIGIVELDPTDIMGGYIHVKYTVDVYTGTCVAMIFVRRAVDMATEQMLYTFSGNASQQLPLTAANFAGAVSGLLSLAGAGLSVATGGALGAAMGFGSAAHSLTQEMIHVQRSSGLSANAGIMTPRKPMIFISRQAGYDANNYASYYGYPANKTVYLSNCSGFVRVKDINLKTTATNGEADEIIQLLKEGVIL